MSLQIIKAGVLDTLQDLGRHGYRHWGINPGGVMDAVSATVANALVGNHKNEAVIEIHFPASQFFFQQSALIAIAGADFSAVINEVAIPIQQPVCVNSNSLLQFKAIRKGARVYIAVQGGFDVLPWLGSCSTNTKISGIDLLGRALQKNDILPFKKHNDFSTLLQGKPFKPLPWRLSNRLDNEDTSTLYVLPGTEWERLSKTAQQQFTNQSYTITRHSDRMAYALNSEPLMMGKKEELISMAVSFGTLQLLPNGQLLLLAADHQTTGGYPRVAHVIKAHHPKIAQAKAGDSFQFIFTTQQAAEKLYISQQQQLIQVQQACSLKLHGLKNL